MGGFSPRKRPKYAWGHVFLSKYPWPFFLAVLLADCSLGGKSRFPPKGLEGVTGWHCTKRWVGTWLLLCFVFQVCWALGGGLGWQMEGPQLE